MTREFLRRGSESETCFRARAGPERLSLLGETLPESQLADRPAEGLPCWRVDTGARSDHHRRHRATSQKDFRKFVSHLSHRVWLLVCLYVAFPAL